MPIPSEEDQRKRLEVIERIATIAAQEVIDLAGEVFRVHCNDEMRKVCAFAFHDYFQHLQDSKITLPEGKYEPHAMYFRTWMMKRLREIGLLMKWEAQ